MIEEYQTKWYNRTRLTNRASEKAIKNFITKEQPKTEQTIYYDWHPTDGFVAYLKND